MAHETSEPKNLLIFGIGVGSIVTLVAVLYGLQSYYYGLRDAERQEKIYGRANPDLLKLRETEQRQLTTYAKLDPDGKRVRIPVDRAMGLLAQRGRDGFAGIKPESSAAAAGSSPAPGTSAAPVTSAQGPGQTMAPPGAPGSAPNRAPGAPPAPGGRAPGGAPPNRPAPPPGGR
jgi:hypothetical protein